MSECRFLPQRIERVYTGPLPEDRGIEHRIDQVAVEEPLEIQVARPEPTAVVATAAITMRTPGHDPELAVGFLIGEGIVRSLSDVLKVETRVPRPGVQIRVVLRAGCAFDLERLRRNFDATSSCGLCGKASLQGLSMDAFAPLPQADPDARIDAARVADLPRRLREAQEVFERTGGLHAAGLFDAGGAPLVVREDVGRHNAVDKVIGACFLAGAWPLPGSILAVSGRASFELMQKAVASGIPMLAAVGAPSSLAVEVARRYGATLVGFTKANGFNIYAGGERIAVSAASPLVAALS